MSQNTHNMDCHLPMVYMIAYIYRYIKTNQSMNEVVRT